MEVGEKDLMRLEPLVFDRLRLLDLDDHIHRLEHSFCGGQDLGTRPLIDRIVRENAASGAGLHHDFVTPRGQLPHGAGHQPDTKLVALDLSGNTDAHWGLRTCGCVQFGAGDHIKDTARKLRKFR